jgi:hypothetical protein
MTQENPNHPPTHVATVVDIALFYEHEHEGQNFRFRRPLVAEIEAMQAKGRNTPTQSQMDFTKNLVYPNDLVAWRTLIDPVTGLPGLAIAVATAVLKKLGFPTGG